MKIISSPKDFQPAFSDLLYVLDDIEPAREINVTVKNSDDSAPIGVKRFIGPGPAEVNLHPYAASCIDPRPATTGECKFSIERGRAAKITVTTEGVRDYEGIFTGAVKKCDLLRPMSLLGFRRTLRSGETDEISFAGQQNVLGCRVEVQGENSFSFHLEEFAVFKEVVTLTVSMNHIESQAATRGYELSDFREIIVTVTADQAEIFTVRYEIQHNAPGSVRLAWVNSLGGIDYHTFEGVDKQTLKSSREEIQIRSGWQTTVSNAILTTQLAGGYHPHNITEALSEITTSPKVWRMDSLSYRPVRVEPGEVAIIADELPATVVRVTEKADIPMQKS